jgi:hypothetical protein
MRFEIANFSICNKLKEQKRKKVKEKKCVVIATQ